MRICKTAMAALLLFTACNDPEKIFVETVDLCGTLLDLHLAQKQRPDRERENRELANFLKKNLSLIEKRLNLVLEYRRENPSDFEVFFQKYRTRIVSILTKLELIHRQERMMLRFIPLVFAPLDVYANEEEMEKFRRLFVSYYEYIFHLAKSNLE